MSCESNVPTPLQAVIDVFICFLVAGSYIPQLLRIARSGRNSNEGISGWYITLLTLSANTFLAARLENLWSQDTIDCLRNGELRGWKVFSALVMYFQVLAQWLAAVALLAAYIAFRQHPSAHHTDNIDVAGVTTPLLLTSANDGQPPHQGYAMQQQKGEAMQQHSQPSNTAILTIVSIHTALVLPVSLAVFIIGRPRNKNWEMLINFFQRAFHEFFLAPSGLLFALPSAIPQIHLIVTRSRAGMDLGTLSVLSLGLQALAFAALAVSQGLRLGWPDWGLHSPPIPVWTWFLLVGGPAVGFGVLAVCQLVVLAVALGVGAPSGGIHL